MSRRIPTAPLARAVPAAVTAGVVGVLAARRVRAGEVFGGRDRWERVNHRGNTVTLLEGPAAGLAALLGLVPAGAWAPAGAVAVLGAGGLGALDDLTEASEDRAAGTKGLRGHLGALRRGRLTTGALKVLGIGATGLLAAALTPGGRAAGGRHRVTVRATALLLVDAGVVAGSANLLNLFDLRPGRALKVALLTAAVLPGAGRVPGAAVAGAAVALLPDDLAGRSMLGDTGANALGALLGVGVLAGLAPRGRVLVLAGLTGLTLLSERVSFSAVIAATPGLRELDAWGRS
ncbi:hypothetical protein ACFFKU_00050 [Kineococcus gynurae]|uniref:UDP-N-acetylmuramyl pentapeptide phosphotransferase/UDP-N-acetylglucosamine-1-phosphate transferase n=1 Tax=Kineococcus gynurae TaxID=452979 RepID=A0ABV5LXP6_9ACTN